MKVKCSENPGDPHQFVVVYWSRYLDSSEIFPVPQILKLEFVPLETSQFCKYFLFVYRQRGPKDNNVVFTTTLIAQSGSNPLPGKVVASLDKTLYDDYLCLEASNKQQINGQEFLEIRKNIESLETPKQLRIPPSTK